MAGSTISNRVTVGVTLGSDAYPSPLTITPAGTIAPTGTIDPSAGATAIVATITGGIVLNQGIVAGGIDLGGLGIGGIGVDIALGSLTNAGQIRGGNGDNLSPFYSALDQQLHGGSGAGGNGIDAKNASLTNNGTIAGGDGESASFYGGNNNGGAGGHGVDLTGGILTNNGGITGGGGGAGEHDGSTGYGGSAVSLSAGSSLTNNGTIAGGVGGSGSDSGRPNGAPGAAGVDATSSSLTNSGTITGGNGGDGSYGGAGAGGAGGAGVDLASGSLTNDGSIIGGKGGDAGHSNLPGNGGSGASLKAGSSLTNNGTISGGRPGYEPDFVAFAGVGGIGVDVSHSTLTNHGVITGGSIAFAYVGPAGNGVNVTNGLLINDGTIAGGAALATFGGIGVDLTASRLTNSGTILGGDYETGVLFRGGGTLTNAGLIGGGGVYNIADAVDFGTGTSRLIIDPGARFDGNVVAQGSSATLELASAASTGTIVGIGTSYSGFGTITVDPGATWLTTGSVIGSGTIGLLAGSELIFDAGVAAGSPVRFISATGTLGLGDPTDFAPSVYGFRPGDAIDFTTITSASSITAGVDGSNDLTLTSDGTLLAEIKLDPAQNFSGHIFNAAPDAGNGTVVTDTPCYCRGTSILTDRGERLVEHLRIGDRLVTLKGAARPIRWIGRRSYSGRFAATNRDVMPVLIRHGALADNVPRRDLLVSPLHALYLDEVLLPAAGLVNGISIVQLEAVDRVDYFHLELDSHDIILAEGAPAETFVDDDSRGMFKNAADYRVMYPDAPREPAHFCAPRVEDGEMLEAIRHRLADRAQPARRGSAEQKLSGSLDRVTRDRITGWARDAGPLDLPVRLRVLDNDVVLAHIVADQARSDRCGTAIRDKYCGFDFSIPGGLSPLADHVIRVQFASDGRDLPHSPWMVQAAGAIDAASVAAPLVVTDPTAPDGTMLGEVDLATRDRIVGWAYDNSAPDTALGLQILDNGVPIARVVANRLRADLATAGIGNGRHGFDIAIPGGLPPFVRHVIRVKREADGADIPGSPAVIEAGGSFDAALEQAVAQAVAGLGPEDDQDHVLSFILAQAERLLQQRADTDSHRAERQAHRQFRRRWGKSAEGMTNAAEPFRRALVIDERLPVERRDAGSQAVLSHIRALQRLGYAVSLVAAAEMATGNPAVAALADIGIACCGTPFYASVEDVLRRQADCFDVVYLHRVDIARRYLALARQHMPRARILYSVADLHHVRLERQAAIEQCPDMLAASRSVRLAEFTAAWSADAVITHSAVEASLLRHAVPAAHVYRVPWDVPVRNTRVKLGARSGVTFIGGYAHSPNVDAAHWLVEAVMPQVWRTDPSIECLLVGSAMPAEVRRLARPGVVAIGHVADINSDVFDRVRLSVAPLRYGAGVKGKVLDSLAAGVPCVMTPIAAEGLSLCGNLQALVGQDATQLAALICHLHRNDVVYRKLIRAGRMLVRNDHSEAIVTQALLAAIEGHGTSVRPLQRRLAIAA